jgi:hypothetical protein
MCWTHVVCGTHVEVFGLNNITNVIKISHLNMIDYECNVAFHDVRILNKFEIYYFIIFWISLLKN